METETQQEDEQGETEKDGEDHHMKGTDTEAETGK